MKFEIFDVNAYIKEKNKKEIILYGQGAMAYLTSLFLKANGVNEFVYASESGGHFTSFEKFMSKKELFDIYDENNHILLWVENVFSRTEALEFDEDGIHSVYSVRKLWEDSKNFDISPYGNLYHNLFEGRDDYFFIEDTIEENEKVYLYSLDAMVTERCSLKCQSCSNLMQYYCEPKNLNIDELIYNIKLLLSKVDRIHDLRILGGEPFMNSDFVKIIEAFKENIKIDKITVYSNATIFPRENKNDILEHLNSHKLVMRLSDYGHLSRELLHWQEWCEENDVRYQIIRVDVWQDLGKLERHEYSIYQLEDLYGSCECRNLPTIIGNKLFNCQYAANAFNLGAMRKDEADRDYIEITDGLTKDTLDSFLYNRSYLEACRYCKGRNIQRASIKPYIQAAKPLEYSKMYDVDIIDEKTELKENGLYMSSELVSVVIPAYNAEKTIEKCVYSLMAQTYQNIEIILVDDGSIDGTVEISNQLIQRNSANRIKLIQNKHGGVLKARIAGIKASVGRFLTFVDADDYVDEKWIEMLVSGMQESDFCMAGWWKENERRYIPDSRFDRGQGKKILHIGYPRAGLYKESEYFKLLIQHIAIDHDLTFNYLWSKMFLASIMKKVCEDFNENICLKEDLLLVLDYALKCSSIKVLDYVGYHYKETFSYVKYDRLLFDIGYVRNAVERLSSATNDVGKYLCDEVYWDFISNMIGKTHNDSGVTHYYYPYFGRLNAKRVILYGAGSVGKSYYKSMIKEPKVEVVAWVDKNANELKQMLPVEDIGILNEVHYDYIIVAVYLEPIYKQICDELICYGVAKEKILWNPTKPFSIL